MIIRKVKKKDFNQYKVLRKEGLKNYQRFDTNNFLSKPEMEKDIL